MKFTLRSTACCMTLGAFGSSIGKVDAALITFDLSTGPVAALTTHLVSESGVNLLIDNPSGNSESGNNTFLFFQGGLFIDGGQAPNLDWTFSENVKLVEYTLATSDSFNVNPTFRLESGPLMSVGNPVDADGTFAFANANTNTYVAATPINLISSNNDIDGYAISSITVDTVPVPEPSSAVFVGLGLLGLIAKRRR